MATGKKSFTAYCDWKDTFDSLPNDKAGQLIKHLMAYVNDENPETDDVLINAVFAQIKATLKRDLKKWEAKREQNRENARKRWNKKDANACGRINRNANDAVSVSVSDSVSDSVKVSSNKLDDDVLYNVDDLKKHYLQSETFNAVLQNKKLKLVDNNDLSKRLDLFTNELKLKGRKMEKWNEYCSYFLNCLKKGMFTETKNTNQKITF
jgi:hypothetical protein